MNLFKKILIVIIIFNSLSIVHAKNELNNEIFNKVEKTDLRSKKIEVNKTKNLLNEIGRSTFMAIEQAYEKGVIHYTNEIMNIIKIRKKLEQSQKPYYYLFSFDLQKVVDMLLYNELYQYQANKFGVKRKGIPSVEFVDYNVTQKLLEANNIDITNNLKYVLTLNGKIAQYCRRNNYTYRNFTQGNGIKKLPFRKYVNKIFEHFSCTIVRLEYTYTYVQDQMFLAPFFYYDYARGVRMLIKLMIEDLNNPRIYINLREKEQKMNEIIKKENLKEFTSGYSLNFSTVTKSHDYYIERRKNDFINNLKFFLKNSFNNEDLFNERMRKSKILNVGDYYKIINLKNSSKSNK